LTAASIGTTLSADKIMDCAKCGEPMRMTDKNTFSGRDIREYKCDQCGHEAWEAYGTALWQILSDDREEFAAAQAAREAAALPDGQTDFPQPKVNPAISRWSRLLAWLGGSKKTK
jgi:hypothetical protein